MTAPKDAEPGIVSARPYALYPDTSEHTGDLFIYVLADSDGDGLPDAEQPAGVVGYNGAVDKCSDQAGSADNDGCPLPVEDSLYQSRQQSEDLFRAALRQEEAALLPMQIQLCVLRWPQALNYILSRAYGASISACLLSTGCHF